VNPEKAKWIDDAKKRTALEAVKHVKDGYIVGLGSGSTAAYAIRRIGEIVKQRNWRILGIPTSYQAFLLAVECGIPITSLNEYSKINLTIDGADQINHDLIMIKGMGGALTREKIVAFVSEQTVIVADETKYVKTLGLNHPVPIEVLPFALAIVVSKISEMGGKVLLREGKGKVGPIVTDNRNFIVDVYFGPIENPQDLNKQLKLIPGVIETGLFIDTADVVYIGMKTGNIRKLEKKGK
jgi:ribose 5-phosphate isomerase A